VYKRQLRAALQRWLPVPAADATPADDGSPGPKDASVDVDVLRGLVGDDPAFVRDLLTDYRASARRLVAAIRSATAAADPDRASKVAHQLKSSSRSVGARRLGELCAGVERAGKTGNLDAVAAELAHLEEEFSVVDAELGVFLEMAPT
jgi:HPt (histidine-containing phosphotransfer) domain-containing protein